MPEFSHSALEATLPELPAAKRKRLTDAFGLKAETVEILVVSPEWGAYFEETAKGMQASDVVLVANYLTSDVASLLKESGMSPFESKMPVEHFRALISMISAGELSSRGAKDILKIVVLEGGEPRAVAEEKGLFQKSDINELEALAKKIIDEQTEAVEGYKQGNHALLQFLIGQGMKATKGSGNPVLLKSVFEKLLS